MFARSEFINLSVSLLVSALAHENGVVDLERRPQLDAQDLHDISLGQQEESLTVYLLGGKKEGPG